MKVVVSGSCLQCRFLVVPLFIFLPDPACHLRTEGADKGCRGLASAAQSNTCKYRVDYILFTLWAKVFADPVLK